MPAPSVPSCWKYRRGVLGEFVCSGLGNDGQFRRVRPAERERDDAVLLARGRAAADCARRYLDILLCKAGAYVLCKEVAAHNLGEVVDQVFAGEPSVVARVIGGDVGVGRGQDAHQHAHGRVVEGRRLLPRTLLDDAEQSDKRHECERNPPSPAKYVPVLAKFHVVLLRGPMCRILRSSRPPESQQACAGSFPH